MVDKRALLLPAAALALGRLDPSSVGADAFAVSASRTASLCRDAPSSPSSSSSRLSLSAATAPTADDATAVPAITERLLALTQNPNVAIVIDVENVRGKTNFELDHADLLDRLAVWTSLRNRAAGRTIAVVDHGGRSSAHLLQRRGGGEDAASGDGAGDGGGPSLCVVFAGPNAKADDVIARDVDWLLSSPQSTVEHVVVITADQELAWRCRSAAWAGDRTAFNAVLRKFADNAGFEPKGKGKPGKKGGKKKRSRAARKRQHLQSQEEQSEEEEQLDTIAGDANATTIAASEESEAPSNNAVPTVEVVPPQRFLEDLEQALLEWLHRQERYARSESVEDAPTSTNDTSMPTPVATLQNLFRLRGQILTLESALRKRCSLHKRHALTGELRKCKGEWREVLSSIATLDDAAEGMNANGKQSLAAALAWSLSSSISTWEDNATDESTPPLAPLPSPSSTSWEQLSPEEQEKLLLRWGKRRGRQGTRRERTEDRIVLAERLRRQLELVVDVSDETRSDEEGSLVAAYAEYINSMM